ncbi:hypothetical protein YC2023_001044 [Brassica napus]
MAYREPETVSHRSLGVKNEGRGKIPRVPPQHISGSKERVNTWDVNQTCSVRSPLYGVVSVVSRVALFVWSSCSGSSGSRRKMGWKCAASLSIGKHQSLRRSDAGRCRESKTTGQRVHEFSFFIACSSSCRIGPRASSFSIFWFVREQTLDGVSCAENERNENNTKQKIRKKSKQRLNLEVKAGQTHYHNRNSKGRLIRTNNLPKKDEPMKPGNFGLSDESSLKDNRQTENSSPIASNHLPTKQTAAT